MTRIPMIAGNWKMNKTAGEGAILTQNLEDIAREVTPAVEVVVAPPFTALQSVSSAISFDRSPIELAAQNVHFEDSGAFTGEISPLMLADLRVDYVIVGHSERRQMFCDTDETVNRKAQAIFAHGMKPIVCCGEELATREAEETLSFIEGQIRGSLANLRSECVHSLVVAYEPIWAIGTGKTATPDMAQEVCAHIRSVLADMFGEDAAADVRILYGGSVKGENAALFFAEEDIDGALVGGAALTVEGFAPIIKAAA